MFVLWRRYQRKNHSLSSRRVRFFTIADLKISPGFTLIEIVIVIAIICTLAGIAVPLYSKHIDTAKVARAKAEIKLIANEILLFSIDSNRYPTDLAEIGLGNILDPYGNPYQYQPSTFIDKNGKVKKTSKPRRDRDLNPVNTDFDLYSMGKDGKSAQEFKPKASHDDIVRANNGLFIGLVSAY